MSQDSIYVTSISTGIIGNCSFSALIDRYANIKWMCWSRFECADGVFEVTDFASRFQLNERYRKPPITIKYQQTFTLVRDLYLVLSWGIPLEGYLSNQPVRVGNEAVLQTQHNTYGPDNGVWEFRGKKSIHAYSLLFH